MPQQSDPNYMLGLLGKYAPSRPTPSLAEMSARGILPWTPTRGMKAGAPGGPSPQALFPTDGVMPAPGVMPGIGPPTAPGSAPPPISGPPPIQPMMPGPVPQAPAQPAPNLGPYPGFYGFNQFGQPNTELQLMAQINAGSGGGG